MVIDPLASDHAALAAGCWGEARTAFEAALAHDELAPDETAQACFGLAAVLWWLGESQESVSRCARAYALFRQAGEVNGAVQCAVWLGITYKANFANFAAASGWIGPAQRLLEPLEPGALHGLDLGGPGLPDGRSGRRRTAHDAGRRPRPAGW
ncbi:MAG: hypothetical protein ACRDTF_00745 [Pseudonocardiaceae bacterium]